MSNFPWFVTNEWVRTKLQVCLLALRLYLILNFTSLIFWGYKSNCSDIKTRFYMKICLNMIFIHKKQYLFWRDNNFKTGRNVTNLIKSSESTTRFYWNVSNYQRIGFCCNVVGRPWNVESNYHNSCSIHFVFFYATFFQTKKFDKYHRSKIDGEVIWE